VFELYLASTECTEKREKKGKGPANRKRNSGPPLMSCEIQSHGDFWFDFSDHQVTSYLHSQCPQRDSGGSRSDCIQSDTINCRVRLDLDNRFLSLISSHDATWTSITGYL
jgi:hypothetical protein